MPEELNAGEENERPRVLVVDGDENTIEKMVQELGDRGYEVDTARSASEAVEKLAGTFDVVVAEIDIPEEGGFAFLNEVRTTPTTAAIPFIFLTADRTVESRQRGLDLGVDDYITKPCVFDEFSARLAAMIRRRKGAEERSRSTQGPADGWDLAGDLSAVHVAEVVRLLTTNQKTGLLRVHSRLASGEVRGEIFLEDGKVRHALLPGVAGGAEVVTLLSDMPPETLANATFDFQAGVRPPMETVGLSAHDLLLTAAKEADHLERVKKDYRDGKK